MPIFSRNPKKIKIDNLTKTINDLMIQESQLKYKIENADLDLKKKQEQVDFELETRRKEQSRIEQEHAKDHSRRMKELEDEYKLKTAELTKKTEMSNLESETTSKLDKMQELAKQKNENEVAVGITKVAHAEEISRIKTEAAKESYDQLKKTIEDVNIKGTESTKFMQEVAMKFFDKIPTGTSDTTKFQIEDNSGKSKVVKIDKKKKK